MPLYRRLPKLKGIAGGMGAGLPKYVSVNLADIMASGLPEGAEVSLESLKEVGLINPTGRERKLPLKVRAILTLHKVLHDMSRLRRNVILEQSISSIKKTQQESLL